MNIFDLHCDTATVLQEKKLPFDNPYTHINASAIQGHSVSQCFAVFLEESLSAQEAFQRFLAVADEILPTIQAPNLTPILTVEGAGILEGSGDWIGLLAARSCRMASLVWNGSNLLATGAVTDDRAPLTARGREAARRCEENHIFLDVSHLSNRGTEEVLSVIDGPVMASHSNARSVTPHPRNLTDGVAREIFRRGGLVGLNLYPPFLSSEKEAFVNDILRHAEHFLRLGGENGLSLGCDLDGVERLPKDLHGFSDLPRLHARFSEAFGSDTADNIFYKNAARVFGQ